MKKLTDEQRKFYETAMTMAKEEMDTLNAEIQAELAAVKERITKLNTHIKAVKQIYDGAAKRLGMETPEVVVTTPKIDGSDSFDDVEEDYTLDEDLIDADDDVEEELEY